MDEERERIIVKSFFKKNRQERILFELFSPRRRRDAISRLSHEFRNLLNEEYMTEIPKPNSNDIKIAELLKKHGATDICYCISFNQDIDERYLPLTFALENAVGYGLPSIISCIPERLAYFESEQCYGAPYRFLLSKF